MSQLHQRPRQSPEQAQPAPPKQPNDDGQAFEPNFRTDPHDRRQAWRRLSAEAFGTFALTLVAAGAEVIGDAAGQPASQAARAVAPGLLVMVMIYTLGDVSGAHFNPAVTLGFAIRHDFPWRRAPGYWLAQFGGGILATLLLRGLFGQRGRLGATLPAPTIGALAALLMEITLTCLLVTVILGTAHRGGLIGPNAALAVGGVIALAGLFAGPATGASMNPARSFGPALLGGALGFYWVYLVGPLVGALLATGLAWIFHGPTNQEARKTAQGR